MLIKMLPKTPYTLLNPNDPNFQLIKTIFETQARVSGETKLIPLFNAKIGKKVVIGVTDKEPYLDVAVDGGKVVILMQVQKLLSDETSSSALLKKIFLHITFGLIFETFHNKPQLITPKMNDFLLTYLFSFYYREVGLRAKIVTSQKQEVALFEILVKKYIIDTILDPDHAPIKYAKLKKYLMHFDAVVYDEAKDKLEKLKLDDINKLVKEFKEFEFLHKNETIQQLFSYAKFKPKTLFYVERPSYLLALLYCIKTNSYDLFDDGMKKYNFAAFKELTKEIYKQL